MKAESTVPFSPSTYVSDVATLATTLFSATMRYLDAFSHFLIRNQPQVTDHLHPVVGCWADEPRSMPAPEPNEMLYRRLLGWSELG